MCPVGVCTVMYCEETTKDGKCCIEVVHETTDYISDIENIAICYSSTATADVNNYSKNAIRRSIADWSLSKNAGNES